MLYIDLDAQGNLSYALGAKEGNYNAMGVLQRPETIKDEIQHIGNKHIIASSTSLAGADNVITQTGKEFRLREALDNVKGEYDFCIIDTPPALSILTINALTASDGMVIPSQADIFSLHGIAQLNDTITAVKKYCNPSLKIYGILLTRYNKRAIISQEIADNLKDTANKLDSKLFETKIRECTAIKEAEAMQQDIYSYAPKSNASSDYKQFTEELLKSL